MKVKHMPTILDNVGYWQVFDDDKQINRFMQMSDEFENVQIDEENMLEESETPDLRSESEDF